MNVIDIVLLIIFAWFAYQGFKKGFVIELASLVALILGIYAAFYFSEYAKNFLVNSLEMDNDYIPVTSFVITFIVVVILVYALGRILEKLIKMVALGFLNKLAGGVFGVLKAVVFISIVILIFNHYNINFLTAEKRADSIFYKPVEEIAPFLWDQLEEIDDGRMEDLRDEVEEISI